jgi:hypothetical protein
MYQSKSVKAVNMSVSKHSNSFTVVVSKVSSSTAVHSILNTLTVGSQSNC